MSTKQYPEDLPPSKHMFVFHPGEASSNQPRWQFGLEEDGRCGVILTYPIPGLPWERGQWTLYYALRDDSHVLRDSRFYRVIMELISPYTSERN